MGSAPLCFAPVWRDRACLGRELYQMWLSGVGTRSWLQGGAAPGKTLSQRGCFASVSPSSVLTAVPRVPFVIPVLSRLVPGVLPQGGRGRERDCHFGA